MAATANRLELLQVADAVAREKNIEQEIVLEAMEDAIQKAARSKYGVENDISAEIDRKTGEIHIARRLEVVENVEIDATQIEVNAAQGRAPATSRNRAGADRRLWRAHPGRCSAAADQSGQGRQAIARPGAHVGRLPCRRITLGTVPRR